MKKLSNGKAEANKKFTSILHNLFYMYGQMREFNKATMFFALLMVPILLLTDYAYIYLPTLVVNQVTRKVTPAHLIHSLAVFALFLFVINMANCIITSHQQNSYLQFRQFLQKKIHHKFCTTSAERIEPLDSIPLFVLSMVL